MVSGGALCCGEWRACAGRFGYLPADVFRQPSSRLALVSRSDDGLSSFSTPNLRSVDFLIVITM